MCSRSAVPAVSAPHVLHTGTTGSPATTELLGSEFHPQAEGKEEAVAEEGTGARVRGSAISS